MNIVTHLAKQIETTQIELDNSLKDINSDFDYILEVAEGKDFIEFLKSTTVEEHDQYFARLSRDNAKETIKRLQATDPATLFLAERRYVVFRKGQELVSPAGFHPSDLVFVAPKGFVVQVDNLKDVPQCNEDLIYHDMTKIKG